MDELTEWLQTPEGMRAAAEAQVFNDDATCRSYGLHFGTPGYAQCRQNIANQRDANNTALAATILANPPPPPPAPSYSPPKCLGCVELPKTYNTNCSFSEYGATCQTQ